jgi:hypothetical protein
MLNNTRICLDTGILTEGLKGVISTGVYKGKEIEIQIGHDWTDSNVIMDGTSDRLVVRSIKIEIIAGKPNTFVIDHVIKNFVEPKPEPKTLPANAQITPTMTDKPQPGCEITKVEENPFEEESKIKPLHIDPKIKRMAEWPHGKPLDNPADEAQVKKQLELEDAQEVLDGGA